MIPSSCAQQTLPPSGEKATPLICLLVRHVFRTSPLSVDHSRTVQSLLAEAIQLAGEGAAGSHVRAALPFAMLEACGELARDLEILPSKIQIARAVEWAWSGFAASSGAAALVPEDLAEANLRRFVAERRTITIKNLDPQPDDPVNNRDAVGWFDSKAVYIPVGRIAEACGGVLSERAMGRMLDERNLLARHKKGRLIVEYVPRVGYVPSYALKFAEFGKAPEIGEPDEESCS